jgi:pimeloyl-ACP methyl ester carboxylesterase
LDNWQTIAKQLGEHFTVFILDQRNHGRSPHLPSHNYLELAEDLKNFMESHWMYTAHIVGHSMGGKVAMQFALEYPDMVEKLVILDIAPKSYRGGHEALIASLNSLDLSTLTDRKEAEAHLMKTIPEAGVRQFLLKNLSRNADGHYEWKMNLPVLTDFYDEILENIQKNDTYEGETLFLRGGDSNYIQENEEALLQECFPKARLQTIANAGHWLHADQPKEVTEQLIKFLV